MAMYQFLISTQTLSKGFGVTELRDKDGNLTGHLMGILNRSLALLENGIKPIWVFDGKPPSLKSGELEERKEKKQKAQEEYEKAMEEGDAAGAAKAAQRTVRVTKEMADDAKRLLDLCGIPQITAPTEAEAQCAQMVKDGIAHATVTEDMDALTFGTKILLRGFGNKKDPIRQITLEKVLEGFGMDMDQFIDLCILCGCDYTGSIAGVGPVKAFNYIQKHKTIEATLKAIEKDNEKRKKKFQVPENFNFIGARTFFHNPHVAEKDKDFVCKFDEEYKAEPGLTDPKWNSPNEEELKAYLVEEKGFSETTTVANALNRFKKAKSKKGQKRLDCFFKAKPK
jgi:flap endonuclease-1